MWFFKAAAGFSDRLPVFPGTEAFFRSGRRIFGQAAGPHENGGSTVKRQKLKDEALQVNLAGVMLKNPVMTASGTFGSGEEFSGFFSPEELGAVVTKGVSMEPWPGNPTPRVAETPSGMLNAIGLQNPGIDTFCREDLPFLHQFDTRIVVNVCGRSEEPVISLINEFLESFSFNCLQASPKSVIPPEFR